MPYKLNDQKQELVWKTLFFYKFKVSSRNLTLISVQVLVQIGLLKLRAVIQTDLSNSEYLKFAYGVNFQANWITTRLQPGIRLESGGTLRKYVDC